jgi:ATP-binding cassette subfamily B protein
LRVDPVDEPFSNAMLIRRLLALSWRYRAGCIKVFLYQVAVLTAGLTSLSLTGVGIDLIRHEL